MNNTNEPMNDLLGINKVYLRNFFKEEAYNEIFSDHFAIIANDKEIFVNGCRICEDIKDELIDQVNLQIDSPRSVRLGYFDFKEQSVSHEILAKKIINSTDLAILSSLSIQLDKELISAQNKPKNLLCLGSLCLYAINKLVQTDCDKKSALFNSITIVESDPRNLNAILSIIDIAKLVECFRQHGIAFNLIFHKAFIALSDALFSYYSTSAPFQFYEVSIVKAPNLSPELVDIDSWLFSDSGISERYIGNLGFSTDEINQVINASYNYIHNTAPRHLCFNPTPYSTEKAIITASGPSLDKHIEWIKANQDKFTIYASSSSIGSLLFNNILPDVIVVSERDSIIYDLLKELLEKYTKAKEVLMICPDTVDPRVPLLFEAVVFYQRPLSSVSALYSQYRNSSLPTAGPESINATFEVAYMQGFRLILGLGCDFAAKKRTQPRAAEAFGHSPRELDTPVMGNLGETVFSQPSLLLVKESIYRLLRACPDIEFTRSGEGAFLKLADTLDILNEDVSKKYTATSHKVSKTSLISSSKSSIVTDVSNELSKLEEALDSYLSSVCSLLSSANEWSIDLERKLVQHFNVNLNESDESLYMLSSRRMLRQSIYHILHIVFAARESLEFNAYKAQAIDSMVLLKNSLSLIYNVVREDASDELFTLENWDHKSMQNRL